MLIAVEPLVLCSLYQSVIGPSSQPKGKSRRTALLQNRALVVAMTELDGVREGVSAEGTKTKEELWTDSSKAASSSSTDPKDGKEG